MYRLATRVFCSTIICATATTAIAHQGHSAPVVHWHAWDFMLLTLLAGAIAGVAFYAAQTFNKKK